MRLLVFFDLPTVTKAEKRAYVQFRRFLLNGADAQEKHLKRLVDALPPAGSVRCMTVTEKQFTGIRLLVGLPLFQEKKVNADQMLLF